MSQQNEQILNLKEAISRLRFLNNLLAEIDENCKKIKEGIFSYDSHENIGFYQDCLAQSNELPKTLNFPILYAIEDDRVKRALEEYKRLFNQNSTLLDSLEENYPIAEYNDTNYYAKVLNTMDEINGIVEMELDLEDYICENVSKLLLDEKINPSMIDSDYVLNVLDIMKEENIVSYMALVKTKLKEIQSSTPYTEVGLEIYKKPVQQQVAYEESNDYQNALQDILKNVNRYDN